MNPDLIAAIIDFLASLAGLFANHPHVGGQANGLINAINAASAGADAATAVLNNPPAPPAPTPTASTTSTLTPGQIIAGKS